ncbi:MAG: NUDIX domain-containing protein [Candidatus Nanosalina sp.]
MRIAKTVLENSDGEILILKDHEEEKWELPGGKIHGEETRFDASRRELKEETGLNTGEHQDLVRIELENGEKIECFVMEAREFSGEVTVSDEHSESRWIDRENLNRVEWHRDAEYNLPVLRYLDEYRGSEKSYGRGEKIDVVKLLIANGEGEFLAVQKTAQEKVSGGEKYKLYGRMAGKWELPGGRIEDGNDRFEAAIKEIREELSLEIRDLRDVVREEVEEKNIVDTWIIYTDSFSGDLKLSKEHDDFKWVSPEEYAELDWHQDAGYGLAPMRHLDSYL